MTNLEFVKATICDLDLPVFEDLKDLLLGEFISFSIIGHENVTVDILAEKLCDYFSTLEIKTRKSFDKYIQIYLKNLDLIAGPYIAKIPSAKRGNDVPAEVPRSRKYYEKATAIKNAMKPSMALLIDYTRIMMCLYTAAIKNEFKPIDNFNYAVSCLDPGAIVESVKSGKVNAAGPRPVRKRFVTKERYSDDVCTLIIMILILYSIINGMVEGEPDYE